MRADSTVRRLRLAHLFMGMMFFYGIEQLFLNKYIGGSSTRGYVSMTYVISLLLFDVPSGMLADTFGRKKIALAACIVQAVSLLFLGLSHSLLFYLVGVVLFGLWFSLINGATQALLYDHLVGQGAAKLYAKYQGSVYAFFLLGAGIANFCSGFIAQYLGLRSAYFLSIVPCAVAIVALAPLYEPTRVKLADQKWYGHLSEVVHEIRTHPRIILFGLQLVVTSLVFITIGEFGQIYILSYGIGTVALGLLWSLDAVFAAGGRYVAHRVQRFPKAAALIYAGILLSFIFTHSAIGIAIFILLYGCNEAMTNIAEVEMQDETKSSVRATMFSMVSFIGNLAAVPILFFFNHIYTTHSLHRANFTIGILAVTILVITTVAVRRAPKTVLA